MEFRTDIALLIEQVDPVLLGWDLEFLCRDPLPCRVLNYHRQGASRSTLEEADEFILARLQSLGFEPQRQRVAVQAFQPDPSVAHGFRKPLPSEPWYDAENIIATLVGTSIPDEAIVVIAHKDSQSWLDRGPGAYDNGVGTVALLEMARLIRRVEHGRSIIFLFCNEEHWPWTSVAGARMLAESSTRIAGAINVDSIGGGSPPSRPTNVTRYSTVEGERIADQVQLVNALYTVGLNQRKAYLPIPNDDDGSFIRAGIPPTVLNIGSFPYLEPHYHTIDDRVEHVDLMTIAMATRLTLASVLLLADEERYGSLVADSPEASINPFI